MKHLIKTAGKIDYVCSQLTQQPNQQEMGWSLSFTDSFFFLYISIFLDLWK